MPSRPIATTGSAQNLSFDESRPSGALRWCERVRHPLRFARTFERQRAELKRRERERRLAEADEYWIALSSLDDGEVVGLDGRDEKPLSGPGDR